MPAEYLDSPPGLHVGRELSDDAQMTGAQLDRSPGRPLRTAAIAGLTFTVLYLLHRILQGTGPDSSAPAAVADYHLAHRSALLASEVAVGLALLAFIPFLAALVPLIWRAGQQTLAVAVGISGGVFVAMGFVSNAAETALIGVADSNQPAAVLALDQLQVAPLSSGRSPRWSRCCRWRFSAPAWSSAGWAWSAWWPPPSSCWARSSASWDAVLRGPRHWSG